TRRPVVGNRWSARAASVPLARPALLGRPVAAPQPSERGQGGGPRRRRPRSLLRCQAVAAAGATGVAPPRAGLRGGAGGGGAVRVAAAPVGPADDRQAVPPLGVGSRRDSCLQEFHRGSGAGAADQGPVRGGSGSRPGIKETASTGS